MRLQDYGKLLLGKECVGCGKCNLAGQPVEHYEHSGGWKVEGFDKRQWLYVKCPACGYDSSLIKLGIPGKATYEEQVEEEQRFGKYSNPPH